MIPKKGYCVTVRDDAVRSGSIGSIVLPERSLQGPDGYRVLASSGDAEFVPGDLVVFRNNPEGTVRMDFDGVQYLIRPVEDAVAVVGGVGMAEVAEQRPYVAETLPDLGLRGVGEKVAVVGRPISGAYRIGSIFVTYERRELGRVNYGPIAAISEELSERTGLKLGQYVLYDYHSAFGHFDGFDVTNEENVVAALTEEEVRHLEEARG